MKAVALALVISLAVAPQAPTPDAKVSRVVLGRVLDVTTDTPIGGAIVTLMTAGANALRRDPASRSVLTTADGYFVVRDLAAGKYAVAATAFGYAGNAYPDHVADVSDGPGPTAITIRLWKHASISGTVVDEHGEAVAGVLVTALRRTVAAARVMLQSEGSGETDDRGIYRIAQLPPGTYAVGVLQTTVSLPADMAAESGPPGTRSAANLAMLRSGYRASNADGYRSGDRVMQQIGPAPPLAPDGRLLAYNNTFAPATARAADATVVTLGSGEARTGIDVAIRFVPAVRVSGVAVGPTGPIAGVGVRLVLADGGDTLDAYTPDYAPIGASMALTDATGAFTFPAVPPAAYTVKASMVDLNPVDATAPRALFASQPLTVGDKDIAGLAIALGRGVRIAGRLEFKGGPPPVLASNRVVVVGLRPLRAGLWRTVAARVTAGDTFSTEGDPPGIYTVYSSGPEGWTLDTISRGTTPLADDVLTLENEDITDLVVTYNRSPTKLSGSVVNATGAVEPDAVVIVFPADTTMWRDGIVSTRRVRRTPATSAGAYEFTGLAPGEYHVAAVSPRYASVWDDPVFLATLLSGATTIRLDSGGGASAVLKTIVPRAQ